MCDFSLQSVRSRPAKVGDKLVTRDFGTGTRGFAAADDPGLAVCVMPGTELAFAGDVACISAGLLGWKTKTDKDNQPPDGNLSTGQQGQSGRASRCARISRWADRVADVTVRGSGSNSASAACPAGDRGRGKCPEARRLRWLKMTTGVSRPPHEAAYFFHEDLRAADQENKHSGDTPPLYCMPR